MADNPSFYIRQATESDVSEILAMIKELALYEKAPEMVQATEQSLLDTLTFPSNPSKGYAKTFLILASDSNNKSNNAETPSSTSTTMTTTTTNETEAKNEARPAGMALYTTNYSTWTSAPGIYLEDLFVRSEYRGRGYGTALIRELARECERIGGKRVEWSVLKWNRPSIDFYVGKTIGATRMEEWVGMRVEGDGIGKLARGD